MGTVKVTFTLDEPTVARLQAAAERLARPKSEVVREAIQDFHERIGRLSERERRHLLRAFDDLVPRIPRRPLARVQKELEDLQRSRRAGGRRSAGTRGR
ncbi:MAG: ribbon-helix-helix protein, CopG family [Acidobacteria bacterium]|nr:ribbon-helix-helix protein, CopG family [Acidobacteriota bacterium]